MNPKVVKVLGNRKARRLAAVLGKDFHIEAWNGSQSVHIWWSDDEEEWVATASPLVGDVFKQLASEMRRIAGVYLAAADRLDSNSTAAKVSRTSEGRSL